MLHWPHTFLQGHMYTCLHWLNIWLHREHACLSDCTPVYIHYIPVSNEYAPVYRDDKPVYTNYTTTYYTPVYPVYKPACIDYTCLYQIQYTCSAQLHMLIVTTHLWVLTEPLFLPTTHLCIVAPTLFLPTTHLCIVAPLYANYILLCQLHTCVLTTHLSTRITYLSILTWIAPTLQAQAIW